MVAPAAVIAMLPLYVPAERPLTFTAVVNDPEFVPEAVDEPFRVSQVALDVAVQLRVPDPELLTVTD